MDEDDSARSSPSKTLRVSKIPTPKASRKTTVPQPFHFASNGRDDNKQDYQDDVAMAQAEEVLRKGLRDGKSVSPRRESKLTQPQAPKLHESRHKIERSTEDTVSMAQSLDVLRKGLRHSDPVTTQTHRPSITRPQSPHFHQSHHARPAERVRDVVSMAQSDDILRKGLRHSEPTSSAPRHSVTRPQSPHFHQSHTRPLPKSTQEMEAELMQEFQQKRFKAVPAPVFSPDTVGEVVSPATSKKVVMTKPQPFHFESDARIGHKPVDYVRKEDVDLQECQRKFKALPLPQGVAQTPPSPSASKKPTQPQPFHLSETKPRQPKVTYTPKEELDLLECELKFKALPLPKNMPKKSGTEISESSSESLLHEETPKPFKALPLPKSIYTSPSRTQRKGFKDDSHSVTSSSKEASSVEGAAPVTSPQAVRVRQASAKARHVARKLPVEPTPAPTIAVPKNLEPFQLECTARHEEFEERRKEQLAKEQEEERKQRSFKARPLPKSMQKNKGEVMPESSQLADNRRVSVTGKKHANGKHPIARNGSLVGSTGSTHPVSKQLTAPAMSLGNWALLVLGVMTFRVLNVFVIQSYFDPDEFWQTMEPAYCQAFSNEKYNCPGFTWEWKRRPPDFVTGFVEQSLLGPARTYLSVLPTYWLFVIAKALRLDSYWIISRGPMFMFAVTVAAPLDLAVFYAAGWLHRPSNSLEDLRKWCLFCSLVSWFNGYSLVRTFANSQETTALMLAIALMSPEFLGDVDARYRFLRGCAAFFLGGLSVSIRFTSLAAFVPMGIILAIRNKSVLQRLRYLFVPCAVFGLGGLGVGLAVDYYFFGFWTLPFLGNFHFNVILDYADLFGSHPFYWYFTTGLPALTGLLVPLLLFDLPRFLRGACSYGERNLWIIVVSYLAIMSFNAHKELRYIHPVLPLVCLLTGRYVRNFLAGSQNLASRLRFGLFGAIFVLVNVVTVLYLGLFHQTGPIMANRKVVEIAQAVFRRNPTHHHFRVYYLTGACHSTPLHSQLHVRPIKFTTWALDCSPDCRASPDRICESEQFALDPIGFLSNAFCLDSDDETCAAGIDYKPIPDFVVTLSTFAKTMGPLLDDLGLQEVARFPQHVNGARLGETEIGDNFDKQDYRLFSIIPEMLEVSLEEMILFARHTT